MTEFTYTYHNPHDIENGKVVSVSILEVFFFTHISYMKTGGGQNVLVCVRIG